MVDPVEKVTNCYLYHICRASDKYDFTKGYIGISSDPVTRWKLHRNGGNKHRLLNAYKKYADIIEYIVVQGSRDYCLYLESVLRDSDRIGWNLVKGGGDPPNKLGINISYEHKRKIGEANSGMRNPKWKGWIEVDGIRYESITQVSRLFNVTIKTVRDRMKNPKFSSWKLIPCEDNYGRASRKNY